MGDDPRIPELINEALSRGNSSSATGGTITNIYSGLGRGASLFVVVAACCAFSLAVGASLTTAIAQRSVRDQMESMKNSLDDKLEAAERRWMDRVTLAEREARIAQDKYTYVQGELAKKGIHISTDGH